MKAALTAATLAIVLNPVVVRSLKPGSLKFFSTQVLLWTFSILLMGWAIAAWRRRNYSTRSKELHFTTIATILSWGIAEAGFWLLKPSLSLPVFEKNPQAGNGAPRYLLRANLTLDYQIAGQKTAIHINGQRMRMDREVSLQKPVGTRRIAFVGDSFTFGCWARDTASTFVGVVEHGLKDNRDVEILNFGEPGNGPENIARQMPRVLSFSPDYVVYVYSNNDFRDAFLGPDKFELTAQGLHFKPDVIREKIPAAYRPRVDSADAGASGSGFSIRNLLVYQIVELLTARVTKVRDATPQEPTRYPTFEVIQELTHDTFWAQRPLPPVGEQGIKVLLDYVADLKTEAETSGAKFVIVALPDIFQLDATTETGTSHGFAYDIRYPQLYVEQYARENKIPFLNLLEPLRAQMREKNEDIILRGEGHFNDSGHRATGERITAFLKGILR